MSDALIRIDALLSSKTHRLLAERALHFGRDRDIEAGNLLSFALRTIMERAADSAVPRERVFSQTEFDKHFAGLRRSHDYEMSKLRARIAELESLVGADRS